MELAEESRDCTPLHFRHLLPGRIWNTLRSFTDDLQIS